MNAVRKRKLREKNCDRLHELKLNPERFGKCKMCKRPVLEGETSGFHFDHKNPTEKHLSISHMISRGFSWGNTILPEIDKCRLLCANCHRIYTLEQNKDHNENVCRKRKRYLLPLNRNKEELEIHEKGERPIKEELYESIKRSSFADVGKTIQK